MPNVLIVRVQTSEIKFFGGGFRCKSKIQIYILAGPAENVRPDCQRFLHSEGFTSRLRLWAAFPLQLENPNSTRPMLPQETWRSDNVIYLYRIPAQVNIPITASLLIICDALSPPITRSLHQAPSSALSTDTLV